MALNCPVCGAAIAARLKYAKLVVCEHCKTSLFLEDDAVKHAGVKSALTDEQSILGLGQRFQYRSWTFEPYGHVRFDYGDGIWDEWWVVLDTGAGKWISVDEGDIVIETPVETEVTLPDFDSVRVGDQIMLLNQGLTVTEKNRSRCIGMEGELPEIVFPGDEHRYIHFSGPRNLLLTGEYFEHNTACYQGTWIDPFDLKPV